jgi:hypothetical protein
VLHTAADSRGRVPHRKLVRRPRPGRPRRRSRGPRRGQRWATPACTRQTTPAFAK